MTRRAPVVALGVAAVSFGSATTGTKYALGGFDPVTLLAVELVLATVVLWACVAIRGFRRPGSLGRVAVLGLFEPALAYLGQTAGLSRTTATNGALIEGLECVFVVLLAAVFLREPISRAVSLAIGLAVIGLVVLESGERLVGPGVGDTLVLFGSLSAAAYTIVARGLSPDDDPLSVTALQFTTATLLAAPVAVAAWTSGAEQLPTRVEPRYLIVAALVGVVGFAGSFVLYNYAIALVQAAPAAVIINLIPAVGLATAVTLLGETLTMYAAVGAMLICASVAVFAGLEALAGEPVLEPVRDPALAPAPPREPVAALGPEPLITLDVRVLVGEVELPVLSQTG